MYFFVKIFNWKKLFFFLKTRSCSNKLSFDTLFVEIGWEFFETLVLRYYLRSGCEKRFFAIKQNFLRPHQNALQTLKQCTKTFQMRYQRPCVLFSILDQVLQSSTTQVLVESHQKCWGHIKKLYYISSISASRNLIWSIKHICTIF